MIVDINEITKIPQSNIVDRKEFYFYKNVLIIRIRKSFEAK